MRQLSIAIAVMCALTGCNQNLATPRTAVPVEEKGRIGLAQLTFAKTLSLTAEEQEIVQGTVLDIVSKCADGPVKRDIEVTFTNLARYDRGQAYWFGSGTKIEGSVRLRAPGEPQIRATYDISIPATFNSLDSLIYNSQGALKVQATFFGRQICRYVLN
jgi:hypothetical protein